MSNFLDKSFENHVSSINNNYIFNTYNENEISMNEDFFRIENNISGNEIDISGNENDISLIGNEIGISKGFSYIFKFPYISDNDNIIDLYDADKLKNNCNTIYKNENNNNKLDLYKKVPLIQEANLAKTSENTKTILKNKRKRKKIKEKGKNGEKIFESNNNESRAKYSIDNLIRRAKTLVLNSMIKFDNNVILKAYHHNIGRGINTKKLLKNDYSQKRDTKIEINKNFLYKTQQEIFSAKISKKNKYKFPEDHNKILIEILLEEKDETKRNLFQNLFSKTFKECIQQISGKEYFECLEGLKQIYDKEMIKMREDEEFKKLINDTINNYEKKLNDRKPKKVKDI